MKRKENWKICENVLDMRKMVRKIVIGILKIGMVEEIIKKIENIVEIGNKERRRISRNGEREKKIVIRVGNESERKRGNREWKCKRFNENYINKILGKELWMKI